MWRKLASRWLALEWAQRWLLCEAAWTLGAAQVAVRLVPFNRIAPRLGRLVKPDDSAELIDKPLSLAQAQQAQRIGWAVQALAHYLPWDARCLAQAIAGQWMLQRRRLPGALFLGVDRGQQRWLDAHAWLRCGEWFITGEPQHERFKVIAIFVKERA